MLASFSLFFYPPPSPPRSSVPRYPSPPARSFKTMPGLVQSYDVLLDFTNDTLDYTSLQLLRDYNNRNGNTAGAVLIPPGETITLVLDAGSVYKYVLKTCTKVASVTYVPRPPRPSPQARARCLGPAFWRQGGYFISEPGSKLTCPPFT